MSDTIIRVENLGKKYIIGHQQEERSRYVALRDVIANGAKSLLKRIQNPKSKIQNNYEEFWALKDVSFEVKQGEVIGIIGRNGAGKSTLLKILSRITEPTTGCISLKGRVASLLEVGTGFHPELTGRENIFLNGAILGMSKAEIKRKFDEIVAFAEVEKFLDTPVKRYSSGMYVRLAFAVAAHLEPEILVVDEVLAVGDAAFQKKCLGKMEDVATKEGRTVLFVSHNMGAVESLCKQALILNQGDIVYSGTADKAISHYLKTCFLENTQELINRKDRKGRGEVRITKIEIEDPSGKKHVPFYPGSDLYISINYTGTNKVRNLQVLIGIYDSLNTGIIRLDTDVTGKIPNILCSTGKIICKAKNINIVPGHYRLNIALFQNGIMDDYIRDAASFDIRESDYFKTGKQIDTKIAKVLIEHSWELG